MVTYLSEWEAPDLAAMLASDAESTHPFHIFVFQHRQHPVGDVVRSSDPASMSHEALLE
jgi:hypothetical protein